MSGKRKIARKVPDYLNCKTFFTSIPCKLISYSRINTLYYNKSSADINTSYGKKSIRKYTENH